MNKVFLTGNVGKEPVIRTTANGKKVAQFTLAVSDGYGDNKQTYWHNIVAWAGQAEFVEKYVDKGTRLLITGKLTSRSYDAKDGTKKYITEVVAEPYGGIEFAGGKRDKAEKVEGPAGEFGSSVSDDDIPF
jgi:single-strand DNA-binding protein